MKSRLVIASLATCLAVSATGIWLVQARTAAPTSQTDNAPARHAFEVAMNLRQSAHAATLPQGATHPTGSAQLRAGGGSADHFRYTRNQLVDPQHVSLAGSYTARSTVYLPDKDGRLVRADPTGVLDFTAQMERGAGTGQWRVASYTWDFAPGSEP